MSIGTTSDSASDSTVIGLLKAVKASSSGAASGGTVPTTTQVNCSAAATIFSANANAKYRCVYNPSSNGVLWVLLGSGTLTGETDCSFPVQPGQTWECLLMGGTVVYTGVLKGLLVSGTNINKTEIE